MEFLNYWITEFVKKMENIHVYCLPKCSRFGIWGFPSWSSIAEMIHFVQVGIQSKMKQKKTWLSRTKICGNYWTLREVWIWKVAKSRTICGEDACLKTAPCDEMKKNTQQSVRQYGKRTWQELSRELGM